MQVLRITMQMRQKKKKICFLTDAALKAANSFTQLLSPILSISCPYLGCSLQICSAVGLRCLKNRAATDAVGHPSPSRCASVRTSYAKCFTCEGPKKRLDDTGARRHYWGLAL